jgi:hypothetical protein
MSRRFPAGMTRTARELAALAAFLVYPNLLGVSARSSISFVWDLGERFKRDLFQTMLHERRIV